MIKAITTNAQLGQFIEEQKPEMLVEGGYVWWMLRDCQDIVACWEYGKIKICSLYYPTAIEHYRELLEISKSWNGFHSDWREVKELAKFRILQIKQALDCHQELALVG
ncbi:Uncharacterized protein dnl_47340 [Desulfonema limicola]|uniref:Uncharacterized protein n=1 Tax=Desulfonema limicola TaxID=45656 RepID=A0A975BBS8_9BACT|nr:hypothetical protein [Desulfonema limicola]QTA82359.1 Uncharacterized protein dnl_47340 [Desulfonema limicola]